MGMSVTLYEATTNQLKNIIATCNNEEFLDELFNEKICLQLAWLSNAWFIEKWCRENLTRDNVIENDRLFVLDSSHTTKLIKQLNDSVNTIMIDDIMSRAEKAYGILPMFDTFNVYDYDDYYYNIVKKAANALSNLDAHRFVIVFVSY